MSIRHYCDLCGEEIKAAREGEKQPEFAQGHTRVRMQRSVRGVWNGGDMHVACMIAVVNEGTRMVPSSDGTVIRSAS